MSAKNWNADACCGNGDRIVVQNPLRLLHQLPFFAIVAMLVDWSIMSKQIEGDRMRKDVRLENLVLQMLHALLFQFEHGLRAGAADGLVCRYDDALNAPEFSQRRDSH